MGSRRTGSAQGADEPEAIGWCFDNVKQKVLGKRVFLRYPRARDGVPASQALTRGKDLKPIESSIQRLSGLADVLEPLKEVLTSELKKCSQI